MPEPNGAARSLALEDLSLLEEANHLIKLKRFRSRTAALTHLAEIRGIRDARGQRSLVERIRQRAARQNLEFHHNKGDV